jgi:hypothetical protein
VVLMILMGESGDATVATTWAFVMGSDMSP